MHLGAARRVHRRLSTPIRLSVTGPAPDGRRRFPGVGGNARQGDETKRLAIAALVVAFAVAAATAGNGTPIDPNSGNPLTLADFGDLP